MRRRLEDFFLALFIASIISAFVIVATGHASGPTQAMLNAADNYGAQYADAQGWQYVDRLATYHGDYRRAYVTLVFTTTYDGLADGKKIKVDGEWDVQARIARCGPGWYVISTPMDQESCTRFHLPSW